MNLLINILRKKILSIYIMDNNLEPIININSKWKKEEEIILKEWADKAVCYKWLHLKSHERFKFVNALYTVPVIIISTLTGTANFAQDKIPSSYLNYYVMSIGSLNIIAGIISTIHQYLKIAEINESHRVAYIAWDKFSRNIRIELVKNPKDRIPVMQILKSCKEEYDRLEETSPPILPMIINMFLNTFGDIQDLIKPDILGKINPTIIYDKYEHLNDSLDEDDNETIQKIINKNKQLELEKQKLENDITVEDIKIHFLQTKGRLPTLEEIDEYNINYKL
jgi:hypothetical protein